MNADEISHTRIHLLVVKQLEGEVLVGHLGRAFILRLEVFEINLAITDLA